MVMVWATSREGLTLQKRKSVEKQARIRLLAVVFPPVRSERQKTVVSADLRVSEDKFSQF